MLEVNKRPDRRITSVEKTDKFLILKTNHGMLKIEPKTSRIIRVLYTLRDSFSKEEKPGVIYGVKFTDWSYDQSDDEITITTKKIKMVVSKESSSISYYNHRDELILAEREYESKNLEEFDSFRIMNEESVEVECIQTPDGIKEVIKDAKMEFDRKLYRTRLHLNFDEDEAIYGLGQHEEGYLNLRGTTIYLNQANLKIAIPFIVSSKGYGILADTYSTSVFNDTNYGSYIYTEADYEMDYYFMYGQDIDGVISCYRKLTGKATMLPKWAFGFVQSQERYETAEEIESIVKEYRSREIGLDCIVLDWHSWPGELWGQKSFDKKNFPNPSSMIKKLHDNNVNFMISIWPNMNAESENYKEFKKNKLLLPASNIYNALDRDGRELFWKQAYEGIFKHGVDAWWCDSTEPFTPEWNQNQKPEASKMYNDFFETCSKYMPAEYTNSYGLMHAIGMYENQRATNDEKRVVNLTRSGYTGQQRYGSILWSGDISANWDTLKKQIAAGLNLCVSGIPYWTLDIGGFFVKKGIQWFWNGDYEKGYDDLAYRELFVRWFQFGCFLPVFRSHGTDIRRELWNFEEDGNIFYDTLIKFNRLRYELMPYIYSMAGKVWKDDYTIIRLLAFDFPNDKKARELDNQYMFGDSIMVCPVTEPMYYDVGSKPIYDVDKTREVYLPIGSGWYDYWTGEFYAGGQTINVDAGLNKIPLFIKEGSIIPTSKAVQHVNQNPRAPLEVHIYPGKDAEFVLYEDEGNGYKYEDGEYSITKMSWNEEKKEFNVNEVEGSFKGQVKDRRIKTHIHGGISI